MIQVKKNQKTGKIEQARMDEEGLCKLLHAEPEEISQWKECFPKHGEVWVLPTGKKEVKEELDIWKKRIALLRTRMTVEAVLNVENAGLLDSYAALAADCPEGLTAHTWRSYGAVVFMQVRENRKIGPHELAIRARLEKIKPGGGTEPDVDTAAKHLRLLIAQGYLRENEEEDRWEHQGLPEFFQS